jgi:uncharacterized membrane protein
MKKPIIAYASALLFIAVADALWLGWLMPAYYQDWLGPLMRAQPLLLPAAAFYLLYPVGVVVLAVLPALAQHSITRCAALSALLGLMAYGTYDLSNLATLENWPVALTLVDMVWGTALTCGAGVTAYLVTRAWLPSVRA